MPIEPLFKFSSGYIMRAIDRQPKQGARLPWRLYQNYLKDMIALRWGKVADGVMEFELPAPIHADDTSGPQSSVPASRTGQEGSYEQPGLH